MTEKQLAMLDAIKLAAGSEAQRIAQQTVNQAVGAGMLPSTTYSIRINVDIERGPSIVVPSSAGPHA